MLINKEDIITCESYKPLCDYIYKGGNDVPAGLWHVNMEELLEFFLAISRYPDRKYVVVSSCSDFGLCYQERNPVWADMPKWARMMAEPKLEYKQAVLSPRCNIEKCNISHLYSVKCYSYTAYTFPEIPTNVKHWFMTNARLSPSEEPRITILPFGVAPNSQDAIMEVAEESEFWEKESGLYINWVNYNVERLEIREHYRTIKQALGLSDIIVVDDAKPYKSYLRDLARYASILSPEGNGVDCYRNLETIYMGSMPILQPSHVSIALADLPLSIVPSMYGLRPKEAYTSYIKLMNNGHSLEKAKLSYWKKEFEAKRSLLCEEIA